MKLFSEKRVNLDFIAENLARVTFNATSDNFLLELKRLLKAMGKDENISESQKKEILVVKILATFFAISKVFPNPVEAKNLLDKLYKKIFDKVCKNSNELIEFKDFFNKRFTVYMEILSPEAKSSEYNLGKQFADYFLNKDIGYNGSMLIIAISKIFIFDIQEIEKYIKEILSGKITTDNIVNTLQELFDLLVADIESLIKNKNILINKEQEQEIIVICIALIIKVTIITLIRFGKKLEITLEITSLFETGVTMKYFKEKEIAIEERIQFQKLLKTREDDYGKMIDCDDDDLAQKLSQFFWNNFFKKDDGTSKKISLEIAFPIEIMSKTREILDGILSNFKVVSSDPDFYKINLWKK